MSSKLTRRGFIKAGGASAVGLALVDQLLAAQADAIDPVSLRTAPNRAHIKVGACDMCGAQDPVFLQVEDGRVVATYANAASAYSGGRICGKAHAGLEKVNHPDRITRPMMRRGVGRYEPVSWDEAIEFMCTRLARIADKYGENAVHVYMGLGSQATIWKSFWKTTYGTVNVFGNDSVCDAGRRTACGITLGDTRPLPDLRHTRVGVLFGADYLASTKYLWYPTQMIEALEQGARFYVVDPRFSETAARAVAYGGKWVPIKPGTDAALALAMAQVVFANPAKYGAKVSSHLVALGASGWADGEHGFGVPQFAASVKDKTPEWAEPITGIPAKLIRTMADDLALSDAPLVDAWTGLSHQANGVYAVRAAMCLAGLVNCIDRKGGLVRQSGFKTASAGCKPVPGAAYRTVGQGGKLVDACGMYGFVRSDCNPFVPKAMLDAGFAATEYRRRRGTPPSPTYEYPVKAFITATRNFANGNSESSLWRKALNRLLADPEALVVDVNMFMSEQAAHAHVVLPEASYVERDDLITPSSLYPTCHVRRAIVPPAGDSKTFFDMAVLLANGLATQGFKGGRFSARDVIPYGSYLEVIRAQVSREQAGGERVDFDTLLRDGTWQASDPSPSYGARSFGWTSLGKFTSTFDFYCRTLGGEVTPDAAVPEDARGAHAAFTLPPKGEFDPLPAQRSTRYSTPTTEFPLRLNGCGRSQWSSASKTVHLRMTVDKEPENVVTLHPQDATPLGIRDRDKVRVTAATGAHIEIRASVTEGIRPGTVHIYNGYGQMNALEPLARRRGANVNELTDASNVDPISGAEGLAEMLVRVEAVS